SNKRPHTPCWDIYLRKRQRLLLGETNLVEIDRRVEVRRGGLGRSLFSPVLPPFRTRVSHHLDHAPSPHPAHRTGRALLRHPALGQGSITPSHSESVRPSPEGYAAPGLRTSNPSGTVSSRDLGPCTWPSTIGGAGTARGSPRAGRPFAPFPAGSSSPSPSVSC